MQAVILAGGLGTRLSHVVSDRPKPMAPVEGKPFLEYLLLSLKSNGISDIVLAVGYLGEMIKAYFSDGAAWGITIAYSFERKRLGTAGAVKNAESLIKDDIFWIINGDTYFELDYERHMEFHKKTGSDFSIVLRHVEDTSRYGSLDIDKNGRIISFREKTESHGSGLINGGTYLMRRELLALMPAVTACSMENEFLPGILQSHKVYGWPDEGYFIDIGVPEDYLKFQKDISGGVIEL